jgi:hypothetical protein
MHAHNTRTARLGLESLEGRIVPSSTTASPPAVIGQQSDASNVEIQYLSAQPASVTSTRASFSAGFVAGPHSIILGTNTQTGNHASTGSVAFALVRSESGALTIGAAPASLKVGFIAVSSTATPTHPDHYVNVPVSITLTLRDAASGRTASITFKGVINGTASWMSSTLKLTFQTPISKSVTLGHHVYTVTMPSSLTLNGAFQPPVTLSAKIQVRNT